MALPTTTRLTVEEARSCIYQFALLFRDSFTDEERDAWAELLMDEKNLTVEEAMTALKRMADDWSDRWPPRYGNWRQYMNDIRTVKNERFLQMQTSAWRKPDDPFARELGCTCDVSEPRHGESCPMYPYQPEYEL